MDGSELVEMFTRRLSSTVISRAATPKLAFRASGIKLNVSQRLARNKHEKTRLKTDGFLGPSYGCIYPKPLKAIGWGGRPSLVEDPRRGSVFEVRKLDAYADKALSRNTSPGANAESPKQGFAQGKKRG